MANVRTTEPHMQPLVNVTNGIMAAVGKYMHSRYVDDPQPDFSNAAILIGHEERRALGYCAGAIALRTDADCERIYDIRVIYVNERSHFSIVENVLNRPRPMPVLCDCHFRTGDHNAKVQEGQQPGTH